MREKTLRKATERRQHMTREGRKRTRKQHSLLVSALKYTQTHTHLPMWQWHIQQWVVQHWTASWRSGRSASAQGRVCRNQEESQISRTERDKQNENERYILNRVLRRFWIWSIRQSGYVNVWTETLQLLGKDIELKTHLNDPDGSRDY